MIWQLARRDPQWRRMMALSAVTAVLVKAAIPTRYAVVAELLSFEAGFFVWLLANLHSSRDSFEAALPIAGRDLWGSRVLALLTVIWCPTLVGIVCGLPTFPLVDAEAIYTVIMLGLKCVRIREPGMPPAFRAGVVWVIFGFSCILFLGKKFMTTYRFALPPVWSVVLVCGLAGVTLFRWGWVKVPRSLQIAPLESGQVTRREARETSKFVLAPVFRSVYTLREMLLLFGFIVGFISFGQFSAVGVFAAIPLIKVRQKCRWLMAFPISQRRLFGLIAVAPTAATALGCVAYTYLSTKYLLTRRERFVEFAAEIALVYVTIFLSELPAWRPLRRLRAWVRWIPYGLSWVIVPLAFSGVGDVRRLAVVLPGNWWQLAAVLVLPAIASYWLAEKAFIDREYHQSLAESLPSRRS